MGGRVDGLVDAEVGSYHSTVHSNQESQENSGGQRLQVSLVVAEVWRDRVGSLARRRGD